MVGTRIAEFSCMEPMKLSDVASVIFLLTVVENAGVGLMAVRMVGLDW
jgi:hypothetical protein